MKNRLTMSAMPTGFSCTKKYVTRKMVSYYTRRGALGKSFPIGFQLMADELLDDGFSLDEARPFAGKLEESGAAYLFVTCGTPESFFNGDGLFAMRSLEGGTSESSKDINGEVSIPVFTTGKMTSVQICEDILASGNAYAVAIHKVLFCDPDLPLKADLVINASGFNPANDFYNKAKGLVNEIYLIGDAKMPRNIHDAY